MNSFKLDGLTYHFVEAGRGKTVVLLHGFTGSVGTWKRLISVLSRQFRVIAIDLPGHGLTSTAVDPERYRMDRVAHDLVQLIERLDGSPASWLGYSMGGRLALYLAVYHPSSVRALALESASPGLFSDGERRKRRSADEALATRLERGDIQSFVDHWEQLPIFETQKILPDFARAALRRQRLANNPSGLASSLRGMGTGAQPSLWDSLNQLAMPVLLIAGELDGKFVEINREMAAAMSHATLRIVPGAGHAVHLERPDAFSLVASDFLSASLQDSRDDHAGAKQN